MSEELKNIIRVALTTAEQDMLNDYITNLQEENEYFSYCDKELRNKIKNFEYKANNLQEENIKLKELCDKYEEEHKTTFIEWQKDIKVNKKAIEEINKRSSKEVAKLYIDILKGDNK